MRASAQVENAIGLTPEVCEIEFRIEAGGPRCQLELV